MTPTWYDLLGVAPDASTEEIRTAWRSAIADLDPGERRFRTLNQAAEVLLDPERRAAYDATLAVEEPEPAEVAAPPASPGPATPEAGERAEDRQTGGATATVQETAGAGAETPGPVEAVGAGPRWAVPGWLLAALAVLVAVLGGAAAYLAAQPSDEAIAEATGSAQSAAERAVTTILSYDYRTMDEDQEAAGALMTPEYREEFDKLFEVLESNQPTTRTVVQVEQIVASGIVRSGEDRVQVLVFLNRSRTNAETTEPDQFRDQVVVTMERDGEGWLVDAMGTSPLSD